MVNLLRVYDNYIVQMINQYIKGRKSTFGKCNFYEKSKKRI
ncbi:protein of unknown function [Clostridium beijerinckii]|nr:protein of unknown function [Clostridium beijerinckii]